MATASNTPEQARTRLIGQADKFGALDVCPPVRTREDYLGELRATLERLAPGLSGKQATLVQAALYLTFQVATLSSEQASTAGQGVAS
jgi:hypothetical protein